MRKIVLQLMALLLITLPLLGVFANQASAASSRVAVIKELKGTVKVKKAGGSKEFTAFAKMSLNEGDILNVGIGGSAVLQFANGTSDDDKMSVSSNTKMMFSKLSNSKGTVTKVSILSGSVWSTVKSISNANDEFTLETPTAIMGVRGTNLLVGVDPETGESKFYIASGLGKIDKKSDDDASTGTLLNPIQQLTLIDQSGNLVDYRNIIDIADLVNNTNAAIIEAIIKSKAAIDKENADYIAKLKKELDSTGPTATLNQEEIDRIQKNLDNLVANIVKSAISQKKVEEKSIRASVDKENETLEKIIDLDNVKPLELSDKEKAKQEELRKLEASKLAKLAEEKKKQDELKKKNEEIINKLNAAKEAQAAANKKVEEEKKAKALAEYEKQLEEAKKKQFEEERLKREAELKGQSPSPSPSSGNSSSSSNSPGPVLSNDAMLTGIQLLSAGDSASPIMYAPEFAANTTSYTAEVGNTVSSIMVKGTASESHAVMKLNGVTQASGSYGEAISLEVGSNTITILVTAEDGTTKKTYTLMVQRKLPPSQLNDINIEGFEVPDTVEFLTTQYEYSFDLDYLPECPSIYFDEDDVVEGSEISVYLDGAPIEQRTQEGRLYFDLYAHEGTNTLLVEVTNPGKAKTTYTFTVTINLPAVPVGLSSWSASVGEATYPIHRASGSENQFYVVLPGNSNHFDLSMDFTSTEGYADLDYIYNDDEEHPPYETIHFSDNTGKNICDLMPGNNSFEVFIGDLDDYIYLTVIVGEPSGDSWDFDEVFGSIMDEESWIYFNFDGSNQYIANVASSVNNISLTGEAVQSSSRIEIYKGEAKLSRALDIGSASVNLIGLEEGWNEYTVTITDITGDVTRSRTYKVSIWREYGDRSPSFPFEVDSWDATVTDGESTRGVIPEHFERPWRYYLEYNYFATLSINPTFVDAVVEGVYIYTYNEIEELLTLTELTLSDNSYNIPNEYFGEVLVKLVSGTGDNKHYFIYSLGLYTPVD